MQHPIGPNHTHGRRVLPTAAEAEKHRFDEGMKLATLAAAKVRSNPNVTDAAKKVRLTAIGLEGRESRCLFRLINLNGVEADERCRI